MCKGGAPHAGADGEAAAAKVAEQAESNDGEAAAAKVAEQAESKKRAAERLDRLQQQALALVEQCSSVQCFSLDTAATYAAEIRCSTDADAMESGIQVLQKQYQEQ